MSIRWIGTATAQAMMQRVLDAVNNPNPDLRRHGHSACTIRAATVQRRCSSSRADRQNARPRLPFRSGLAACRLTREQAMPRPRTDLHLVRRPAGVPSHMSWLGTCCITVSWRRSSSASAGCLSCAGLSLWNRRRAADSEAPCQDGCRHSRWSSFRLSTRKRSSPRRSSAS